MWNWREYYQLVEQVRKYTRVLYRGESLVQIPEETICLHTISGKYDPYRQESFFCGYDAGTISTGNMVWMYLKKMPSGENVFFHTVFLRYDGKKQGERRKHKGIRMVYRSLADKTKDGEQGEEAFFMDVSFQKLVIIGKEEELRKAAVQEFLNLFGKAADERGMMLLSEQNARLLYHGQKAQGTLHQFMG